MTFMVLALHYSKYQVIITVGSKFVPDKYSFYIKPVIFYYHNVILSKQLALRPLLEENY